MLQGRVLRVAVKAQVPGEPGLPKPAVAAALLTAAGFEGDYNRYRQQEKAGTPDMAVLLLPNETLAQLRKEGWPVQPGDLGENLTLEGLPYEALSAGLRLKVGEAVIEISEPCTPCRTLGKLPYIGPAKAPGFIKATLGRRGWYARVLKEGRVRTGDLVEAR